MIKTCPNCNEDLEVIGVLTTRDGLSYRELELEDIDLTDDSKEYYCKNCDYDLTEDIFSS